MKRIVHNVRVNYHRIFDGHSGKRKGNFVRPAFIEVEHTVPHRRQNKTSTNMTEHSRLTQQSLEYNRRMLDGSTLVTVVSLTVRDLSSCRWRDSRPTLCEWSCGVLGPVRALYQWTSSNGKFKVLGKD